jgi:hypothetical protein
MQVSSRLDAVLFVAYSRKVFFHLQPASSLFMFGLVSFFGDFMVASWSKQTKIKTELFVAN